LYLFFAFISAQNQIYARVLGSVSVISSSEIKRTVIEANEKWQLAFSVANSKVLKAIMIRDSDQDTGRVQVKNGVTKDIQSEAELRFILAVRRQAQIMRTTSAYFTANHKAPNYFRQFVRALGLYKDARVALIDKIGDPEANLNTMMDAAKYLRSVLRNDDKKLRDYLDNTLLSSKDSLEKYIQDCIASLNLMVSHLRRNADGGYSLVEEEFHQLRKTLRGIEWYLELTSQSQRGIAPIELRALIEEIDKIQKKKLGRKHDLLVESNVDDLKAIKSTSMEVSKRSLHVVKLVLNTFGNVASDRRLNFLINAIERSKEEIVVDSCSEALSK
jgi:CHAD domain-containing protein